MLNSVSNATLLQTLAQTHNMNKPKKTCVVETVNPKAVTGEGRMTSVDHDKRLIVIVKIWADLSLFAISLDILGEYIDNICPEIFNSLFFLFYLDALPQEMSSMAT